MVIAFEDVGNNQYGTAVVVNPYTFDTNLTSENYIGIAAAGISSGQTGQVYVVGGISTAQSGLTTAQRYYVQNTGGISTSASTPSVVAGFSLSSTNILVQKS